MSAACPVILLAAGFSRRWGAADKLLHALEGEPIVRRTARAVLAGGLSPLWVVTRTGAAGDAVWAALRDLPDARRVESVDAAKGMGASVRAGWQALADAGAGQGGFGVLPGDLCFLQPATVQRLREVFAAHGGHKVVVPGFEGTQGHPVLFPGAWLARATELPDARGAGAWLKQARPGVIEIVAVDDPGVTRDLDRPADLTDGAAR